MRIWLYKNILLKSLVIFLVMISGIATGQLNELGHYPIYNFSPKQYGALDQNWCAVQDSRGIMYFGNNMGVLEYDGEEWDLISPTDGSPVYSLAADENGRIFFGSVNEFGYLQPDSIGQLEYHLLSDMVPEEYRSFSEIWETHVIDGGVIFQSFHHIFIWKNDSISVIHSEDEINELFHVGDDLFISYRDSLGYLDGNQILPISRGEISDSTRIYGMLQISNGNTLIGTEDDGFLRIVSLGDDLRNANIINVRTKNDALFTSLDVFKLLRIGPNRISLGTWGNGSIIIDTLFNVISIIDKESGLQAEVVQGQYTDENGNLWLALSSGISRVETQSAITQYNDFEGLEGRIESITRFNNTIYVSTNVGLFFMDHEYYDPDIRGVKQAQFKAVKGFDFECWDMITYQKGNDEVLLVITNTDVMELTRGHESNTVFDGFAYKLFQSRLDPNRVFIGLESGLTSLYRNSGKWIQEDPIEGIDEMISNLSEEENGDLWMGTREEGVLKLQIQNYDGFRIGEYTLKKYNEEHGVSGGPFIISQLRGKPTIATNKGLFKFNAQEQNFTPDSTFGDQFGDGSLFIHRISELDDLGVFMVTLPEDVGNKYPVGYLSEESTGIYSWIHQPFTRISEEVIHAIYQEQGGVVWLGGSHGLFRFNPDIVKDYNKEYNAYVRRVEGGSGTLLFGGAFSDDNRIQSLIQPESKKLLLPYKENSLIFTYAAQPGEDESFNRYSYYLEGNDKGWSDWSPESKKEYTNLHERSYTFHIRAKNIYGQISKEFRYEFTILAPWYRKFWAFIIYLIIAAFIVYEIVNIYTRRLRGIIRERTAEVVAQKEVIEKKNNDIMDSILYAEKIQRAMMPPEDDLGRMDLDGFILFQPLNIVSGDFYWLGQKDGKIITVAADCTGHGVPGAFMSMLGVAFLNNIVGAQGIISAASILDELRAEVIAALKQKGHEGEQKDGMDMALHVIDYEHMKIEFAGANNPMIMIRDNELIQFKADRMPIGIHERVDEPFRNQTMDIKKGDVFYIFSDGFQDQFGGPKNKKFMIRRLKELFLEIHEKPMSEQKKILEKTFYDWIVPYGADQIDDIIVIGIRI